MIGFGDLKFLLTWNQQNVFVVSFYIVYTQRV